MNVVPLKISYGQVRLVRLVRWEAKRWRTVREVQA